MWTSNLFTIATVIDTDIVKHCANIYFEYCHFEVVRAVLLELNDAGPDATTGCSLWYSMLGTGISNRYIDLKRSDLLSRLTDGRRLRSR